MKKKMLFNVSITMFMIFFAIETGAQTPQSGTAVTTRYWDSCKPSCGWTANANPACVDCSVSGSVLSNRNTQSSCNNGASYTCMFQAPFTGSDGRGYGYAASHSNGDCGKCFELTFTSTGVSGKKMVIMVSNIGGDVGRNQFDLMIPGGGVGLFNALSQQVRDNGGPSNPSLGQQYGGFRATCGNNRDCIRKMCDDNFSTPALAHLKSGCYWYIDWFEIADNPGATFTQVTCPTELSSRYNGTNTSYGGVGGINPPPPPPQSYTLTTNVNPANPPGGTITRAPNTPTYPAGAQVTLTANDHAGYTFQRWSGTTTSNSRTVVITMNGNQTMTANFQETAPPPPTTRTLTVNRNPTAGGSVTVNGAAYTNPTNHNNGASVTVVATPASGYTFTGWLGVPQGVNTNSASITFNINSNLTIMANFQQSTTPPTTRTLTVNRNPTAGGSVTVNGAAYTNPTSHNNGASVTVVATPASGYTFTNWTGAPQGVNANNASVTFNINSNVTMTANFQQSGGTAHTLTVNRNPTAGGSVTVNGAAYTNPTSHNNGASVTVAATPANGYTFVNWTGAPQGVNANNASVTFNINNSVTMTANFQQGTVPPPPPDVTGVGTIKVEAESLTQTLPNCNLGQDNPMCIATENGITNIGYIVDGSVASYNNVNAETAGTYAMEFRVATGLESSNFTILVNGNEVGRITLPNTGGWDTYTTVKLSSNVPLNQGANTVELRFASAVNIDYFQFVGNEKVSIRHSVVKTGNTRTHITLQSAAGGFTAFLPAGHGYTSYKLINLQGKEIRTGRFGANTSDLRFNNLGNSVLFLKLEGKGQAPAVLKAVTY